MSFILEMDDDIAGLIFENLQLITLMKVLMTCRQFYAQRKRAIANNATVFAYAQYNSDEKFMPVYAKSDIQYNDNMRLMLKHFLQASARAVILNTYKLLAFDNIYHNNDPCTMLWNKEVLLKYYEQQNSLMLGGIYVSTRDDEWCSKQLCKLFTTYCWSYTCIDMFDIYRIIFCVRTKKFKILVEIMQNMRIEAPQNKEVFINICRTLMHYIDILQSENSYGKNLQAVMVAILFRFAYHMPVSMLDKILQHMFINQADNLGEQIDRRIKYMPKYVKKALRQQLNNVKFKILAHGDL